MPARLAVEQKSRLFKDLDSSIAGWPQSIWNLAAPRDITLGGGNFVLKAVADRQADPAPIARAQELLKD